MRVVLLVVLLLGVVLGYSTFSDVTKIYSGGGLNYSVYTGFVEIDIAEDQKARCSMFYQYVTKEGESLTNHSSDSPVLIWLNGGPGSSSQLGSWTEVGPFYLNQSKVEERVERWNKLAHLIFLDQPVSNVGLSFCRESNYIVKDTPKASEHFMQFVRKVLMNTTGELSSLVENPFFLLGESFGGHYAPYFANAILEGTNISLKGVVLADAWVNPSMQMMNYDSVMASAGIISSNLKGRMVGYQSKAYQNILEKNFTEATKQFDLLTSSSTYGISVYNFMRPIDSAPSEHQKWLNANKELYGVPTFVNFTQTCMQVYSAFASDVSQSYSRQVQALLLKTKLLVYVGQFDMIVNPTTTFDFVNALDWEGIVDWQISKKRIWKINDKVVGSIKQQTNLTVAMIYGAGHMVPTDQPVPAFELVKDFLANEIDPSAKVSYQL